MQDSDPGAHAPEETMKERVRRVIVRLVTKEEMPRWIDLMSRHHYLGRPEMVGEALCYVATVDDEWVALMGWASAALHLTRLEPAESRVPRLGAEYAAVGGGLAGSL